MPIYKKTKGNISLIKEETFKLEKDIQVLIENNLNELFGLEFVSSERIIRGLRIDSLAFNNESKNFVIIEYKKNSSFSVIDQGFSYLSLLLNNKHEFIQEYNEKKDTKLKLVDIDWSQTKVVFISPQFTTHQLNAMNFKNIPFEIWEIKKFDNDIFSITQIKSDTPEEFAPILGEVSEIKKIMHEVRNYTEEQHVANRKVGGSLFLGFKERVKENYPELVFDPKSKSINLKHPNSPKVIVYLNIYSNKVRLSFTRSKLRDFQDSRKKLKSATTREVENKNQDLVRMEITTTEDIEYAFSLFQQAYTRFKSNFI